MKSILLLALAAAPLAAQSPRELVSISQVAPDDHKVAGFVLSQPEFLSVEALGAQVDGRRDAWRADAWILETTTRAVVWSLHGARTTTAKGLARYEGPIRLPAGTYEAHFASAAGGTALERDRAVEKFMFRISGNGRPARARELKEAVNSVTDLAFVRFDPDSGLTRTGFELDRPATVELIAIGSLNQSDRYDYGWVQNAETRKVVWRMTFDSTRPAGGSGWNRIAHDTLELPAGRYVATWVANPDHGPDNRTRLPPWDPALRGLTLRVPDEPTRRTIRRFAWVPVPPDSQVIAAIDNPGDDEHRTRPFGLRRALDVRIYAVGECSDRQGDPDDGAWLLELGTGRHVWDMKCEQTQPAGGSRKNRMVDTLLSLQPGNYSLVWKSDGSHSAKGGWNADAPWEPRYWGVSLFPASGVLQPGTVGPVVRDTTGMLAEIARVRNRQHVRRYFSVEAATPVEIHAEGESSNGEMVDFGWIETGKGLKVWVMNFGSTRHAGGAEKNRVADTTLTLQPGRYVVHYTTDDSHAYGDWNARPPDEPEGWGVVVRKAQ